MRRHTLIGERIVLAAPALANTAPLIRSSHERIDGHGYPDGLAGDNIPLGSRIIAVCDAYHAMTSDRAYRPGIGIDAALQQLHRHAGTQFDPTVVEAFCKMKVAAALQQRTAPEHHQSISGSSIRQAPRSSRGE
jgi:two-component system cell cycle response regulator